MQVRKRPPRARSIRKKPFSAAAEKEDDTPDSANSAATATPAATTAVAPKPVQRGKLSFGDEEPVGLAARKPLHTAIQRQTPKRAERRELPAHFQRSAAGEYTPEKLSELKKNSTTFYFTSTTRPSEPLPEFLEGEPSLGTTAEQLDASDSALLEPDLPDREAIKHARARRERMRQLRDFIPLEDTTQGSLSSSLHSRLIREDDEDNDAEIFEEHQGGRIAFGDPNKRARDVRKTTEREISNSGDEEDDDDEVKRWEVEQMKKGVRGKEVGNQSVDLAIGCIEPATTRPQVQGGLDIHAQGELDTITLPDVDGLQRLLQQAADSLKQKRMDGQKRLENSRRAITESEANIESMRTQLTKLSADFRFYQDLREYVLDLVDCLGEKIPKIEELEKRAHQVITTYYSSLRHRRQQEVEQQLQEFSGRGAPERLQGLQNDSEQMKRRETWERQFRAEQEKHLQTDVAPIYSGLLCTDVLDTDNAKLEEYRKERAALVRQTEELMGDVVEEYASLPFILHKFKIWREEHTEDYSSCFATLSLPDIFVPLIRLECLTWDPFQEDSLESLPWYSLLQQFAASSPPALQGKEGDTAIMSEILRRVVLPRVVMVLGQLWDPFSQTQTKTMVTLVSSLLPHLASQDSIKVLCTAALVNIQGAVDSISLPQSLLTAPQGSLAHWFVMRQFWCAVGLIENICEWREQLSNRTLQALVGGKIIDGRLLPALRQLSKVLGEDKPAVRTMLSLCGGVARVLPSRWTRPSPSVPPGAANWLGLFRDFAHRLCVQCKAANYCDTEPVTPTFLSTLLRNIGDDGDGM